MSFWEDLSPGVKRYIIFAVVFLASLPVLKKCFGGGPAGDPEPRGVQKSPAAAP